MQIIVRVNPVRSPEDQQLPQVVCDGDLKNSGFDIALVQRLLQHSSAAVTQRYIGIEPQRIERAIEGHAKLI